MSTPSSSVLLALHYQNDVLHEDGKIRLGIAEGSEGRAAIVAAAKRLLEGARRARVPVVHVRIAFRPDHADVLRNAPIFENVARIGAVAEGSWGAEFHAGLHPLPEEIVVKHSRVNAFFNSSLEEALQLYRPAHLAIAGVATNSVVEHTARHAVDMGYRVTVLSDACSSSMPHLHQAALDNVRIIGQVATVDEQVAAWSRG